MKENNKKIPNFFIVGACKSGTSSLYEYLSQHPEIYMSPSKEPLYFVPEDQVNPHYYGEWGNYLKLFGDVRQEKAIGEASTPYLYYPESAKRIKETFPDSKIIILLRNPVEIAFSQYQHYFRISAEDFSFEKALKMENERLNDPKFKVEARKFHAGYYYMDRARLYRQVKCYKDHFGRQKVLIIFFKDLKNDPVKTCQRVFKFLGVDPAFRPDIEIYNPAWTARFRLLNKLLLYPNKIDIFFRYLIPSIRLRERLLKWILEKNRNYHKKPAINESTRIKLLEEFREDIDNLEKLLNVELSHWKN